MRSPSFRHSTEVQTVLFDVSAFTPATAAAWARSHGFRAPAGDVTARYIRLRQREPAAYRAGTFRTITLTDGVLAVVGVPKTGGNLKPRKNPAHPEYVLWGLPRGETDALYQKILYTQGKTLADVERVKGAASLDGWHTFRVQTLDLSQPFNAGAAFAGSVRKNAGGSTRPTRTAQVTAYLAANGFPGLKLHKGAGYLYVSGGGSETWPETSIMTYRVSDQTLDQWLSDVRRLAGGARRNGSLSAARARLLAAQEAYALLRRHHGGSMIGWAEYKRTVARMSPEAILAEAREDVNHQNPKRKNAGYSRSTRPQVTCPKCYGAKRFPPTRTSRRVFASPVAERGR